MKQTIGFDIQYQLKLWVNSLKSESSITESDAEELKSHLLDSIEQLKENGLDDEEAFWVASRRLGLASEWEGEYREANDWVFSLRRSAVILAGVLAYFLFYHLFGSLSKLLFIILLHFDVNGITAVFWFSRFLIGVHILFIIFFLHLYFRDKNLISFIENIKLKPRHVIQLFLTAIFFGITNHCLMAVAKNVIGKNLMIRDRLIHIHIYFQYTFPLLICLGFILIYSKYYKQAKF